MSAIPRTTIAMQTLLLCSDVQFLGTTRRVLNQLQVTPRIVKDSCQALQAIQSDEFDVIVLDWREIDNLADFLCSVRRSTMNRDCVLVAIVRDLLDLRQAFAAGVHFLIHKPPSTLQIERCLHAAYSATVTRRRRQHRETVEIPAVVTMGDRTIDGITIVNISSAGCGVQLRQVKGFAGFEPLGAGNELDLRFAIPGKETILHPSGRIVWTGRDAAGIHFTGMPESDRAAFDSWLTECVEHSLAELCERLQRVCA